MWTDEERDALQGLRVLMWVVIAVEVPVYLVWLVQVGYQAGQQLPRPGNVAPYGRSDLIKPRDGQTAPAVRSHQDQYQPAQET